MEDDDEPGYDVRLIIWINGGFGAGKTTLAEELHSRLSDAVLDDPEDVGQMLWKWLPREGDFQHLQAGGNSSSQPRSRCAATRRRP